MSNEQLIKSAHIWALVILLFGVIVFASKGGSNQAELAQQNTNTNTNTSRNQNQNSNTNQSSNANRNRNTNNSNATGEQAGMTAMSSRDRNFMMDAAMSGMMEVELGRLAVQQGASDAVKQFGQRMVDDHSRANTELMQLASSKGMTLPTELDEKHRNNVTRLSRLTGAEFDRAYAKMMLDEHDDDVEDFEKQSMRGADADLKAFAASTLPTLREHLQMARALPGNTGTGGNRNVNRNGNSNRNDNGNRNNNGNSINP